MVYPHKRSPVSCRSSAGQGKFTGQRPTCYHYAMQPTMLWPLSNVAITCCLIVDTERTLNCFCCYSMNDWMMLRWTGLSDSPLFAVVTFRVSTTSGNTENLLEFEIPSGNTGNLVEFNCSSWKFLYNRLMVDNWQEWHLVIKFSCSPFIGNCLA